MNTATETAPALIPVPFTRGHLRNEDKAKTSHTCLICGRDVDPARGLHVEMTTSLMLIPAGHPASDTEESQGCFPVGPDCAAKLPAAYRLTFPVKK